MLCLWLMERVTDRPDALEEWLFGISASLGFLGHFLFAGAYAGLLTWTLVNLVKSRRRWAARLLSCLNLHFLPFVTIAGLAYYFGGQPMTGGGERQRLSDVLIQAGSLAIGGPESGRLAEVCCGVAVLAAAMGLLLLLRRGEGLFYFAIGSTIGLVLMIWYAKPEAIYMRHFLIPVVCIIMAFAHLLARLWIAGVWGRLCYLAAISLFLAGNACRSYTRLAEVRTRRLSGGASADPGGIEIACVDCGQRL